MKSNILIRPIKKQDKDEVLQMMQVFVADSTACAYSILPSNEILKKMFEDCLSDIPYLDGFVVEKNSQIVAYFLVTTSYDTEYGGICIRLEDLYVKPEYRRNGILEEGFKFIENYYPDAVCFRCEMMPENKKVFRCSEKCGYYALPYIQMQKKKENH